MKNLKLLILEDHKDEATLMQLILKRSGFYYNVKVASSKKDFVNALDSFVPAIILSDHKLPRFRSNEALKIARQKLPDVVFILVTGTVSEEFAATIIKEGADDYILKDRLARLPAAIEAAVIKRRTVKEIADYKYALDESAIVAITDQTGIITYANENFSKISGYAIKELIGQDHRIINSGYHPKAYIRNLWVTIANGNIWKGELCNKAKDGSFYWVNTTIIPFLNEKGNPYQYLAIRIDITENKKTELELQSTHDRLSFHIDNAPLGFIEWDNELHVKSWSKQAQEIFGWTENEFISRQRNGYNQVYIEDAPWVNKIAGQLISGEVENNSIQHRNYTKDGKVIWCEWFNSVLKNENGEVVTILSLVQDITARKQTQQQIEFDSNNLSALINNTGDLIWSVDRNLKLITFNDSFAKVIELTSGKPIAKGANVLSTQFTKEQLKRYKTFYKRALAGEAFTIIDHFDYPAEFWSEISFNPIKQKGEIIGTACFSRDITERKKAEDDLRYSEMRLNKAQALTHISNWEINFKTNEHLWSDEFYRIYGLNKSDVIPSAEVFLSFMHPDDADFAGKRVQEFFDFFKNSSFNFRFIRADGVVRHGYAEWKFEFDSHGKPLRLFGILQDVTERIEAEGTLKDLQQRMLNQQIQEQKKIARAMILAEEKEKNHLGQELHDNINQLLAGTKLYLSMAGNENAQVKKLIQYPMQLIDNSIEEIRLLCRAMVTPIKNIDLKELVERLLNTLKQNSSIQTAFTYSVKCNLLSDDLKLNIYRITQEQTNNIVKYAEAKNINISITEEGDSIHVIVTDDGKGFNVNNAREGIGMSNIKNRIESYNGKFKIVSSPGNGCEIMLSVPLYN